MLDTFLQALPVSITPVLTTQKDLNPTSLRQLENELMPLIQDTVKIDTCNQIQTKEVSIKTNSTSEKLVSFACKVQRSTLVLLFKAR